jgi:phosphoribosylaminoimidazolecarboxamide formyltransferase/IMP cyclohydrolase
MFHLPIFALPELLRGTIVKIKSALVSVYHKKGFEPLIRTLHQHGVLLYATGGSLDFIQSMGIPVTAVEDVTHFPSILGGRVKTLHPKIFGGILNRRNNQTDVLEVEKHAIPAIDLVVVDLYPFEETVASGAAHHDIIEKIDIGGVSLIRAAAKNFEDVVIITSVDDATYFLENYQLLQGESDLNTRLKLAHQAFSLTSRYDAAIMNYFNGKIPTSKPILHINEHQVMPLRYGENPHQRGYYYGHLEKFFTQLSGKELSYNNLLDCEAAVNLIAEFTSDAGVAAAIIKHNNACGIALRPYAIDAWKAALAADPVSAFGGIIVLNSTVDETTAQEIHAIFFEIIIAPSFTEEAITILTQKKNKIILQLKQLPQERQSIRSALGGYLVQDMDNQPLSKANWNNITERKATTTETDDMLFATKVIRNLKSNAIVLVKQQQLLGSGVGQTSRVDALKQAIAKAHEFGFDLKGAIMASDAFFPFADCVEIAYQAGIEAVVQPGGSIKDKDSIEYCNKNNMTMVLTGKRHFKH